MSVPTVVTVIQGFRAQLLNREQAAMQEAARRWLQVEQALGAQIEATTLQLIANGDFSISQAMRSRRWLSLMEQTRDELRKYRDYMEPRITNGQRTLATQAIGHSATAINAVATEAQIVVPFNRLPMSAVESMIGLAGDGSPLRDVLQDACNAGADAMGQQLVNGVALGLNPREVARRAMRLGLGQSFTRMQTIARTEQLRVYRLTSLESYRNSRVVVAYRRLSARDRRTCVACLFADGQEYPIADGFDEHPAGRCTTIPVLANVPRIEYETGQEWFNTQPEAVQREMLGPARFDLWQRGEVTLDDMVSRDWSDTWGGSLRVTNVGQLRGGAGRAWQGGGPVAPSGDGAASVRQKIIETTAAQRTEMEALSATLNELKAEVFPLSDEFCKLGTRKLHSTLSVEQMARHDELFEILAKKRSVLVETQERLATLQKATTEAARVQLKAQTPANVKWRVGRGTKIPATWQEGMNGFNELVDASLIREGDVEIKAKAGRALYSPDKVVKVQKNDEARIVIHELGHWLEDTNPEIHDKILEFYDKRTKGESLTWLGNGYRKDEKTRKDKFISPYMGKEYVRGGVRYATEILSMGLERMYADPVALAMKDPDYFDFIFNLMRGR